MRKARRCARAREREGARERQEEKGSLRNRRAK
ncbi:hypothetical protein A2U01_0079074, partial [Trifolium medium]|nr:hypothetical protein [Trifolium medium]